MARPTRKRDPFRDGQARAVTVVEQTAVDLHFDYSTLPEAYREQTKQSALTIKPRLKRAAEDIFVIGRELRVVKEQLPHGEYSRWLDIEFGLSLRMAQRFMGVYERLGTKSDNLSLLAPSTLYLLAAPSTPDEAIQTVEARLATGEHLGVEYVQRVIADAKRKFNSPPEIPVNGEAPADTPIEAVRPNERDKAQRLNGVLTQVYDLLTGEPDDTWAILFHNSELTRVRNEIYQLREQLRKRIRTEGR
jgi:hypothetical protein